MNGREAIQAMLGGKEIGDSEGRCLRWHEVDGFQVWNGLSKTWVGWAFSGADTYSIFEQPNPHKPGTYFWAKEEHARGRSVISPAGDRVRAGYDWSKIVLYPGEFEGDTWEIDQ